MGNESMSLPNNEEDLREIVLNRVYEEDLHIDEVETKDIQEIVETAQIAAASILPEWFGVNEKDATPRIVIENPFEAIFVNLALKAKTDEELGQLIANASKATNYKQSPLKPDIVVGLMKLRESKSL